MNGKAIIEAVARKHDIRPKDIFASRAASTARNEVCTMLLAAGFNPAAAAKLLGCDRRTFLYWSDPAHRARRRARYVPNGRPMHLFQSKTTAEQRATLLALRSSGDRSAMNAMEAQLGLKAGYTNKLADKLDCKALPAHAPVREALAMSCRKVNAAGAKA